MMKAVRPVKNRLWIDAHHQAPEPFAESLFSDDAVFGREKLISIVNELKTTTENRVSESIRLMPENYLYMLAIHTHFPPHVPYHLTRVQLRHSLLESDVQILLIVKDMKAPETRGGRKILDPYEHTIKHYETLLKQKGIEPNFIIMTLKQLMNDYVTLDERRKLCFMYEKILVDSNIGLIVNTYLGYKMMLESRIALPVDLNAENLSHEIDTVLRTVTVFYRIYENRGRLHHLRIGRHSNMTSEQIAENIIDFLRQAYMIVPGGTANIQNITLKPSIYVSSAIELYANRDPPKMPTKAATTETKDDNNTTIGSNWDDIKTEDVTMETVNETENFDDEIENLLERNYYENLSIIGPDFVHDEHHDDEYNLYVHYAPEEDDDELDDKNSKDNNNTQTVVEGNGNAKKNANPQMSGPLNGRNPDEINRLIMEGLKKILRTGTLPQLSNRGGGVNLSNNPISRRNNNNNRRRNKVSGN